MAYAKAELKNNDKKTLPHLKTILIGNMSAKFLPVWSLLYVSFRHMFISLNQFHGDPKLNENNIQDIPPN